MKKKHDGDLLERWRLAGEVLNRINPEMLRFALLLAEISVLRTPEDSTEINSVDLIA